MSAGARYENLEAEYRSAGGFWMRFADIQVLKTQDADAIDRLTTRKRRRMTLGQFAFMALALPQVPLVLSAVEERGWYAAAGPLFWIAVAAIVCWRLQVTKREFADASVRLVAHLRERGEPDGAATLRADRTEPPAGRRSPAP
jgi:hypothetical protein